MRYHYTQLICAIVLVSFFWAARAACDEATREIHIVHFGDSITEAGYVRPIHRVEAITQKQLRAGYKNDKIFCHNVSRGGRWIAKFMRPGGWYETKCLRAHKRMDMCFIMFAVNDEDHRTPDQFKADLIAMCERVETDYPGVKIVLCTAVHVKDRDWWARMGADAEEPISRKYYSKTRQVAAERGYLLVDVYKHMVEQMHKGNWDMFIRNQKLSRKHYKKVIVDDSKDAQRAEDGTKWFKDVHPNVRGLKLIADLEVEVLRAAYPEKLPSDGTVKPTSPLPIPTSAPISIEPPILTYPGEIAGPHLTKTVAANNSLYVFCPARIAVKDDRRYDALQYTVIEGDTVVATEPIGPLRLFEDFSIELESDNHAVRACLIDNDQDKEARLALYTTPLTTPSEVNVNEYESRTIDFTDKKNRLKTTLVGYSHSYRVLEARSFGGGFDGAWAFGWCIRFRRDFAWSDSVFSHRRKACIWQLGSETLLRGAIGGVNSYVTEYATGVAKGAPVVAYVDKNVFTRHRVPRMAWLRKGTWTATEVPMKCAPDQSVGVMGLRCEDGDAYALWSLWSEKKNHAAYLSAFRIDDESVHSTPIPVNERTVSGAIVCDGKRIYVLLGGHSGRLYVHTVSNGGVVHSQTLNAVYAVSMSAEVIAGDLHCVLDNYDPELKVERVYHRRVPMSELGR